MTPPSSRLLSRAAATVLLLAVPFAAEAGEKPAGTLAIEINRLDAAGADCRVTLVEKNATGLAVETLKLDLVVFDRDEIVAKRIGVDAGPLKAGRTVVRTFDLKATDCAGVGRFLINDVIACVAGDLSAEACLDAVEPRSRTGVGFEK